jgi:LPXTG-motif cell wall-anchored protein
VSYVVAQTDEGTTIVNNAVVTVRTVGPGPQGFQAADPAEVAVPRAGEQVEPTTTAAMPATGLADTGSNSGPQLLAAALALTSGSLLLLIGRRRNVS